MTYSAGNQPGNFSNIIRLIWNEFRSIASSFTGIDSSATSTAVTIDASNNVVISTAALATTATDGFLYIPTCAGTPTGAPTAYTGRAPMVLDTTNN